MADDEKVQQFLAVISDADVGLATHYLEMAGGDVESAVGLYLSLQQPSAQSPPARAPASNGGGAFDEHPDIPPHLLEDEQEEVRRPIQAFEDTLYSSGRGGRMFGASHMMASNLDSMQRHMDAMAQHHAQAMAGLRPHGGMLGAMRPNGDNLLFPAPTDISFKGDFETAKEHARAQGKHVLVNVQDYSEFESQVLNRDVWSLDTIRELIQGFFVFVQVEHNEQEGQLICSYYPQCAQLPFLGVINARTGELMKQIKGTSPVRVTEQLMNVVEEAHAPSPVRQQQQQPAAPPPHQPQVREPQQEDAPIVIPDDPMPSPKEEAKSEAQQPSVAVPPAPADDHPSAVAISFRLPSGERVERKFLPSNTVEELLAFTHSQGANDQAYCLQTTFPKRVLDPKQTIEELAMPRRFMLVVERAQ